jgi:hypothetical protein
MNEELFLTTKDLAIMSAVVARLCTSGSLKPDEMLPIGVVYEKCQKLMKRAQEMAEESKRLKKLKEEEKEE